MKKIVDSHGIFLPATVKLLLIVFMHFWIVSSESCDQLGDTQLLTSLLCWLWIVSSASCVGKYINMDLFVLLAVDWTIAELACTVGSELILLQLFHAHFDSPY